MNLGRESDKWRNKNRQPERRVNIDFGIKDILIRYYNVDLVWVRFARYANLNAFVITFETIFCCKMHSSVLILPLKCPFQCTFPFPNRKKGVWLSLWDDARFECTHNCYCYIKQHTHDFQTVPANLFKSKQAQKVQFYLRYYLLLWLRHSVLPHTNIHLLTYFGRSPTILSFFDFCVFFSYRFRFSLLNSLCLKINSSSAFDSVYSFQTP